MGIQGLNDRATKQFTKGYKRIEGKSGAETLKIGLASLKSWKTEFTSPDFLFPTCATCLLTLGHFGLAETGPSKGWEYFWPCDSPRSLKFAENPSLDKHGI